MTPPQPARSRWLLALTTALVAGLVLLPWLHNHGYLRDLYDYGIVIAANARMDDGQRPYRDFTTPIQAGFFAGNHLAEKLGGGTYAALTRGAAIGTVLAAITLVAVLARRFASPLAGPLALSVLAGSMSQHTILRHNSVGVVALALVAWSAALPPLWRRESAPLHALTAAGLFLGGVNKLNFHLLAVAAALGWALFAAIQQRGTTRELLRTVAAIALFGFVAPLAAELAWTRATFAQWWYNVVTLAAGTRAGYLGSLLEPEYYLYPRHDY